MLNLLQRLQILKGFQNITTTSSKWYFFDKYCDDGVHTAISCFSLYDSEVYLRAEHPSVSEWYSDLRYFCGMMTLVLKWGFLASASHDSEVYQCAKHPRFSEYHNHFKQVVFFWLKTMLGGSNLERRIPLKLLIDLDPYLLAARSEPPPLGFPDLHPKGLGHLCIAWLVMIYVDLQI